MNDLAPRLEAFLRARTPGATSVAVRDVTVHTEGFSQETFSFRSEIAGVAGHWVVKREPVSGLLEPYDLEPEFRVLHALSDDPCPLRARPGSSATRASSSARST